MTGESTAGEYVDSLLLIMKLSRDFDILTQKTIKLGNKDIVLLESYIESDSTMIIAGVKDTLIFPARPFVLRLDADYNVVDINEGFALSIVSDLAPKPDGSGYFILGEGSGSGPPNYDVFYVDQNLYVEGGIHFNIQFSIFQNADVETIGNYVYFFGRHSEPWDKVDLGIGRFDGELFFQNKVYFGDLTPGVQDYAAAVRSISVTAEKDIYCGGTSGFALLATEFVTSPSYFVLAKFDTLLNKYWEHYYGGDAYYVMFGLMATADGGCLMYGKRYDYNNESRVDLVAIKVDADGNLTTMTTMPFEAEPASLYPNPFFAQCSVTLPAGVAQASLWLFNTAGQRVYESLVTSGEPIRPLLPAGVYFYQLIGEKGALLGRGKAVKQ